MEEKTPQWVQNLCEIAIYNFHVHEVFHLYEFQYLTYEITDFEQKQEENITTQHCKIQENTPP